ncbi:MAG: glycosyltransferase family 39 protein [Hyphomicrobiaceae bacterium]|nr:glycosyltransferase family 39 protein [Hyphomicrobiaceae bacterium]MCC0010621.1 glycosyltransferase family 39 protein [Hyphomicrobiaceae bacterium]
MAIVVVCQGWDRLSGSLLHRASCDISEPSLGWGALAVLLDGVTASVERWANNTLERLAFSPLLAVMVLVVLVLALDLSGNLLLAPLDRTEVIYAQTAKQMLEPEGVGGWTAPAFQTEPKFEKPLAVLWLQAGSAWLTGQVDQIRGYRIPSMFGTILAVLIAFWGARYLFNGRVAFVGAALLATMLVITVQATLAMPEALMLASTCAAMFAMARAYVAGDADKPDSSNAIVFWLALGLGVVVNVATVPLIAALAATGLVLWDRGQAGWLARLASLPGVVLFVVIAALWPLVLWQAGTLDQAVSQWHEEGLHLLLGPQEMKWRVLPGLFVVFLLLGAFPAGLFLGPALLTAWHERMIPAVRVLVAWPVPYLLFLELFTRKTPLYMVQAMLPPLAVLFALWVTESVATRDEKQTNRRLWFRLGTLGWVLLVAVLVAGLWVLPFLLKQTVSPLAVALGAIALTFAVLCTKAMLDGQRLAAAALLVGMAVAFNNLAIPVTFAGLKPVWVATQLRAVVEPLQRCAPGRVTLDGFSEPSGVFEVGPSVASTQVTPRPPGLMVLSASQQKKLAPPASGWSPGAACVAAYDFIHACSHRFEIWAYATPADLRGCPLPARYRCENVPAGPMLGKMCK